MSACPFELCDGGGFLYDEDSNTARPCRCRPQRISRARARSLSAVIPRRFRNASWDRKPVVDIEQRDQVRRFADRIDDHVAAGDGLCLFGDIGTGKTTLAMLVSCTALERGHSVAIYSLPRLLTEIRTTFGSDAEHTHAQLLDRLAQIDLLHIDDLGAENTTPWVLEELYSIINTRYEEQRSMIITTNLERERLREQLGDRIVSRLAEMCLDIPVFGPDKRQGYDAA